MTTTASAFRRPFAFAACGNLVLVLLSLVTGSPGPAVLAILVSVILVVATPNPRRLRVSGTVASPQGDLQEGQPIDLQVELQNTARSTKYMDWELRVAATAEAQGTTCGSMERLAPGKVAAAEVRATFRLFGRNTIGPLRARFVDVFGLTCTDLELVPRQEVRVAPATQGDDDTPVKSKQPRPLVGIYEVAQHGTGFEFHGLRDYAPGDRPRDVNWKASGRVGRLIVNQRQKENDAEVVILVDLRASSTCGQLTKSPFANGCRTALAVAQAHLRSRDRVRLLLYGSHQATLPRPTRRVEDLVDLVLDARPGGNQRLGEVVDQVLPMLRPGTPVVVASHLVGDEGLPDAIAALRSHNHPVTAVVTRPTWGGQAGPAAHRWAAMQDELLERVRAQGAVVFRGITGEGGFRQLVPA